jgi:hypothetical protein
MRRIRPSVQFQRLLPLSVALGVSLMLVATAASSSKTAAPTCETQGARYTQSGRTTSTFEIGVVGATCDFAKPWVSRLTHQRASARGSIPGGPPGWRCETDPGVIAAYGGCFRPDNGQLNKYDEIHWSPKFAPRPPSHANLRVYDVRVVGFGHVHFPGDANGNRPGDEREHWTQTVPEFRITVTRRTAGAWELAEIRGQKNKRGDVTITVDELPDSLLHEVYPGAGATCPRPPTTYHAGLLASAGPALANIAISLGGYINDACGASLDVVHGNGKELPIVVFGGHPQTELDEEVTPDITSIRLSAVRKRPAPFQFPLNKIVAGVSFVMNLDITNTASCCPGQFSNAKVRITFTARKP